MDPDDNEQGNKKGSTSRPRQISESDEKSGKRQRILSTEDGDGTNSGLGIIAASPPRFVLLEEVMNATKGLTNMAIAHEIAADKDFKLKPKEYPENSLAKTIKDTVHRAFWDVFKERLEQDPPDYSHALTLLAEIKKNLNSLLLPHHTRIKQEISEMLDIELIKQQAEHGALDFQKYAKYVISVMAKICAPVRDDQIRELAKQTDVVEIFKGIMEILHLMEIDMVNFTIQIIRPGIVDYEKEEFKKYLAARRAENQDGLIITREWLKKVIDQAENANRNKNDILNEAFLQLLQTDIFPLPETMIADGVRFAELKIACNRLSAIAAIMLVTMSTVGSALRDITDFRSQIKEHICLLIPESTVEPDIEKLLPSINQQIIKESNEFLEKHGFPLLTQETESILSGQILSISKPDDKIKEITRKRIYEFLHKSINNERPTRLQIPQGLSALQYELATLAKRFVQLVSHNRAVFGEFYDEILSLLLPN